MQKNLKSNKQKNSINNKRLKFSIIGYPLNNPRSVPLWRNFLKKKKINGKMYPIELMPKKLNSFVKRFKEEENFIASAVTMPFKEKIFNKVFIEDKISSYAKAINLIVKKRDKILGYNTDVYAMLKCLPKNKKNILIIGQGGTGKATFNVLRNLNKKIKFNIISSKHKLLNLKFKGRAKFFPRVNDDILKHADLIINCTPLGSNLNKIWIRQTPLNKRQIGILNKKCVIFDLVYKPSKTILSNLSRKSKIKYINGLKMNTLQAERALDIVFKNLKELN